MKNNFEIIKLNNEPYDFLIIATSYENPLSHIKEIGKEIHVPRAKLLFDLTLINGTNKNRYIKCEYEADRNQLQPCCVVEGVNATIKKISQNFLAENEEAVQKSVIPNSLKYLLQSDMV
jgi:hypothetical protein